MENSAGTISEKKLRFLHANTEINSWENIESYFQDLEKREISSPEDLRTYLLDLSELESFIAENLGWRYIKMTIDTRDEAKRDSYSFFVNEIQPKISPEFFKLNKKIYSSPYFKDLNEEDYKIFKRNLKTEIELYRDENVPLQSKDSVLGQEYGTVSASMAISWKGEELTMQQAARLLQNTERKEREEVYKLISQRRLEDREKNNEILSKMIEIRTDIAKNAGFDNFRDYKFRSMGRFDYTPEDCAEFHENVRLELVPLLNEQRKQRKEKLGLEKLRPWDLAVDVDGNAALQPFDNAEELYQRTLAVFNKLDPFFAECLEKMNDLGHLDLSSQPGKAPGGYNYPLYETGAPFIFMNAVGSQRDLVTIVHEGGHAVHSFLTNHFELVSFKSLTSEIAELASMSMELLTMDYWDEFYKNPEELKRAKLDHLEDILGVLPWIMLIDKFQHWLYTHSKHTHTEREEKWLEFMDQFSDDITDWSGFEDSKKITWQKQLHIFEVPFYYIEYAMAQLGAIAVWRNYKKNPEQALNSYKTALGLGYSKTIGEVYEAAGIRFDFSREYLKELFMFLQEEIEKLK